MPIERKPAAPDNDPGYPSSDEYNADRRTFLWFVGAAATGAVGYLSYKAFSQPQVMPAGVPPPIKSVGGTTTPPVQPQVVTPGAVPAAQPQAAVPGEAPAVAPPPAQPQAEVPGKVAPNIQAQPQPPAQPQAQPRGGVRAPAQPQAQAEGGVKASVPPAQPQARPLGEPLPAPKAPAMPQAEPLGDGKPVAPAQPKAIIKGGAGLKRVKRNQQSA